MAITSLSWIQASLSLDDDDVFHSSSASASKEVEDGEDAASSTVWSETSLLREDSAKFLQKLPSLAKSQGVHNLATKKEAPQDNAEDAKKIQDQKCLNVLTVAFGANMIQLLAFGLCPIGNKEIELPGTGSRVNKILGAYLSRDLRSLSVVVELETSSLMQQQKQQQQSSSFSSSFSHQLLTYDSSVLVRRHREIRVLAQRYGQLISLQDYMAETLKLMKEAWEDILQVDRGVVRSL